MSSDAELMGRVRSGDEAAFAALMEEWELPLKAFIGRIVQNAAEAEDLAQESFVRVWQQRGRFRDGAAFRPWIFAIAVNLARNRLRWWRRRPEISLDAWMEAARGAGPAGGGASAGDQLARREEIEQVRAAVAALPAPLRVALVLAEYEGLSHAEIAAATGGSIKSVESRLYRARQQLQRALAGRR